MGQFNDGYEKYSFSVKAPATLLYHIHLCESSIVLLFIRSRPVGWGRLDNKWIKNESVIIGARFNTF